MTKAYISGTGLFTPPFKISNEELVESFNSYVNKYNVQHKSEIESGKINELLPSSCEFIVKASGIKNRYVMDKDGILDINLMRPNSLERPSEKESIQCEMAIAAAKEALEQANISTTEIDTVLVACSNMQRAYPAIAIEIQNALGIEGFAFDLNVACSSATFGISAAVSNIKSGISKCVLVVNPEICSAHINFKDRDSHFIFGDACTAIIVQNKENLRSNNAFEVLDINLKTLFSNNIRNNFGFLVKTKPEDFENNDKLFKQNGRMVFKEVVPMVTELLLSQINNNNLNPIDIKRFWLHQANINMNSLIAKKLYGTEPNFLQAPTILDEYANTSSAGSIIAFNKYNSDLKPGDLGIICSFGAGYSIGSVIIKKIN